VMYANTATRTITLNVTGVKQLTLVVNDAGDGIDNDHADWAGARLLSPALTAQTTAAAVNAATDVKSRGARAISTSASS
jgi:NPCBM/NEW2 domain-containing protein